MGAGGFVPNGGDLLHFPKRMSRLYYKNMGGNEKKKRRGRNECDMEREAVMYT